MVLNHCYGEDTMRHPILTAALAGTVALTMVGCSTNKDDQSASGDKSDKPVIVASTNVWGSVARAVGGDQAEVKSVITKPTQDPHDYEATAQDKLAWLDRQLGERRFVCGDRLTLADIMLFAFLDFGAQVGQPINPELKAIAAHHAMMKARPSVAA